MSQSVELQKTFWYTCGKFGIAPWRGVAVVLIENRVRRIGQMGIWLNAGEQQVGVKQMATKNAVPRRTFRVGCPHVMRHIVLTALLVLSFRTMATIRYEYLDNSQRVEIVPSQGDVNRLVQPGKREIVWNAKTDVNGVEKLEIQAEVRAWSTNCPPDYMGVFEVTQAQLLKWYPNRTFLSSWSGVDTSMLPADNVNYTALRGDQDTADYYWPTAGHTVNPGGILGTLRGMVGAQTDYQFDLPTY